MAPQAALLAIVSVDARGTLIFADDATGGRL